MTIGVVDELYTKYRGIARNVALSFHNRQKFQELLDEADSYLAVLLLDGRYDSSKGQWTTYLFNMIRWHLYDYLKSEFHHSSRCLVDVSLLNDDVIREHRHDFAWVYADLSKDARFIVDLILDDPAKYKRRRGSKISAKKLRLHMIFNEGWSPQKVNCALSELKENLVT